MPRSTKAVLDEFNPNKGMAASQAVKMGSALANAPAHVQGAVSSHVLVLPEDAKAERALSGYARAGTVTGALAGVAGGAPATTEVGVNAEGDLVFQATDAVTDAEVMYVPMEGDIVEDLVIQVSSDIGEPQQGRSARLLLEVEALSGTATGTKTIAARGSTPGAGAAAITDDGKVEFAAADAVTSARIKYIAFPGVGTGVADSLQGRLAADFDR